MDSGIVINFLLGTLWALGCLIFVMFLYEFRDDMSPHRNYPAHDKKRHDPNDPKELTVASRG